MYEKMTIVIIIIFLIIIGNKITQEYTKSCVYEINQELKNLKKEINTEKNEYDIESLYMKWRSMYKKLTLYIEHDELEKVDVQLLNIKSNLEVKKYEETIEQIDECIFILEHIKDKETLKLENLF